MASSVVVVKGGLAVTITFFEHASPGRDICRFFATENIRAGHQPQDRKVLGSDVPPLLPAQADEVIE
jgi:hypothetical protein